MKRVLCVLLCALLCALAGCALAQVTDGTYSVTVPSYSVTEQMTLEVTFEGGRIAAIEAVTEGSTAPIFAVAQNVINHCGRFVVQIDTWLPARTPMETSARANSSTSLPTRIYMTGTSPQSRR